MRGLVGAPVVGGRADGHRPQPARAGDGRGAVRPPDPGVRRPPGPGRCHPGPHPAGSRAEQYLGRLRGAADPQALSARRRRREPGPGARTLSDREDVLHPHRPGGRGPRVPQGHRGTDHRRHPPRLRAEPGGCLGVHAGGPRPLLCGCSRPAERGARRGAPPALARPGGGGRPAAGRRADRPVRGVGPVAGPAHGRAAPRAGVRPG